MSINNSYVVPDIFIVIAEVGLAIGKQAPISYNYQPILTTITTILIYTIYNQHYSSSNISRNIILCFNYRSYYYNGCYK